MSPEVKLLIMASSLFVAGCTATRNCSEYRGEVRTISIPSTEDSTKSILMKRLVVVSSGSGGRSKEINGGLIFPFNEEYAFHLVGDTLIESFRTYTHGKDPSTDRGRILSSITFTSSEIRDDSVHRPGKMVFIDAGKCPGLEQSTLFFDCNIATIRYPGGKITVELSSLIGTDEEGNIVTQLVPKP